MEQLAITVKEATELLRISRFTLYKLLKQGALPKANVGRRILIPKQAVLEFLSNGGVSKITGQEM